MEVPRHWRMKKQRYSLTGEVCPRCSAHLFPPRAVCPHCAEEARQQAAFIQQPQILLVQKESAAAVR